MLIKECTIILDFTLSFLFIAQLAMNVHQATRAGARNEAFLSLHSRWVPHPPDNPATPCNNLNKKNCKKPKISGAGSASEERYFGR